MERLRAAQAAKFLQLDLPFNLLLVFIRIIIPPLALGAAHRDEAISAFYLSHGKDCTISLKKRKRALKRYCSYSLNHLLVYKKMERFPGMLQ